MRTWKTLILSATAAALLLPATASAAFLHVVARGESLSSIAATDGLTVAQLAAANGLSPTTQLVAGTTVAIPPQGSAPGETAAAPATADATTDTSQATTEDASYTSDASTGGGYVVQSGDTLTAIAARYGMTVNELAADNGLNPNHLLIAGTHLSVPGAAASDDESATTTEDVSAPVTSSDQAAPDETTSDTGSGAQPTDEFVSPSEVGSIAEEEGVPASLAEAIGYQESGFNNDEVSPTGAIGVMQIEPGTWHYIGQNLAGPPPLSADSAVDNVRAGTLLLHSLLAETGDNAAEAAAAYYQGLPSVERHGMYPSTQQYVKDVMSLQEQFGGQ